ncbi:NAD-dependent epimerase/dehydratase family protein [Polynucleobacter sp. 73C-SIWE]|uniref:NAD-dependent epimerase/dehydratase family protein n=1 Tax=Polynucleobacter sp. 73C-SIWE TaxID=2689098 RepID=UPI001C0E2AF0|nr:NAD-dependent epimerase/dehydratase family protein [Polynucleobacter sp. 73C-SIWE]MBU3578624.1 NAD-dependent epimerase/dehydratase family protein [Polynucleobacter sp. 73C-SIWE]
MNKILVTGANGFVGLGLISRLLSEGFQVLSVVRSRDPNAIRNPNLSYASMGNLSSQQEWGECLIGIDTVIHLAARAHILTDSAINSIDQYRIDNVTSTLNLAIQARRSGVRRFIYMSSIKVNGDFTELGIPFTAKDAPNPQDPYGVSKCEAELALKDVVKNSEMELVIIRPPLVYGPGVKANFLALMVCLLRRYPLPLGGITKNRRSFVFLGNLVDLLIVCIGSPVAANQTFLVSDGQDLSTSELLRGIGAALDRHTFLIPFPEAWVRFFASYIGGPGVARRLCDSLQLDIEPTKRLLNWTPPFTVEEGLRLTALSFLQKGANV